MKNNLTQSSSETYYDLEYDGKFYNVVYHEDYNMGYSEIRVLEEGVELDDSPLKKELIRYVSQRL